MSESLRLRPVLNVLVAGHRQERLQRNWNIQSDSKRSEYLNDALQVVLAQVKQVGAQVFQDAHVLYEGSPEYRLLTGVATGVDEMARGLASANGYSLRMMTASTPKERLDYDHQLVSLDNSRTQSDMDESDYRLRDDILLTFSDITIAVWDEQEPIKIRSGTAHLIRNALIKRTPVILLSLPKGSDTPVIKMTELTRLTEARLLEMQTMECSPYQLLACFSEADDLHCLSRRLDEYLRLILAPFQMSEAVQEELKQHQLIIEQPSFLQYCLQTFWFVLSFGVLPKPMNSKQWLKRQTTWLKAMFHPPQMSQAFRVYRILHASAERETFQDRTIRHIHVFCIALSRLELRRLLSAFMPGAGAPQISMSAEQMPKSACISSIGWSFAWADQQAHIYSSRHKHDIWVIYFAAAFAVLCAVAGTLKIWPASQEGLTLTWVFFEYFLLHFILRRVLRSRFNDWHGHWLSYRFIAEQLRYANIGYPQLVFPSSFHHSYWTVQQNTLSFRSAELWVLQRVLKTQGLPQPESGYCLSEQNQELLKGMQKVIDEHRTYFLNSYQTLHHEHSYLHKLAFGLFSVTFLAVTVHFFVNLSWILIFTAFFPAWGAAIHGILSHNEVARMSAMSGRVWSQLDTFNDAFELYQIRLLEPDKTVMGTWDKAKELREMTRALLNILSEQNQEWRSLLQHNHPDLPG
ncbi:hypothetical protein DN062_08095 [Nitrincola tibetensis]|uniref:Uncharacterized protein n=1 Tax=Nitrincola tibetensis TaxID=2219697 RepID=A0A364NMA7_9GAMM|nr:hypothetical protein [Nitrincola tibetensis]RAU18191.1 hypothetical protein DN062_08095 [Nitrincola tibetensis]